ncbi:MAG: 2-phospho-L-lactate transferase CofD family protein [Acidobacteriota bacterium]
MAPTTSWTSVLSGAERADLPDGCVVLFSGGSALARTAPVLADAEPGVLHLVTTFDSGGSSGPLRRAFRMPAVGDLRNRMLALASPRQEALRRFLARRLPSGEGPDLRQQLETWSVTTPADSAVLAWARSCLARCLERLPDEFPLGRASVGNLVLTVLYLEADRDLDAAVRELGERLEIRAHVRPIADCDLHLLARLDDGRSLVGQHAMTGREGPPPDRPIDELRLVESLSEPRPARVHLRPELARAIENASLLVFPIGSFYSSVLANLLPSGVGRAIAAARCPKVLVLNTRADPEQLGLTAESAVERLLAVLQADLPPESPRAGLLDVVLTDSTGCVGLPVEETLADRLSVAVERRPLVAPADATKAVDPERLTKALLDLAVPRSRPGQGQS